MTNFSEESRPLGEILSFGPLTTRRQAGKVCRMKCSVKFSLCESFTGISADRWKKINSLKLRANSPLGFANTWLRQHLASPTLSQKGGQKRRAVGHLVPLPLCSSGCPSCPGCHHAVICQLMVNCCKVYCARAEAISLARSPSTSNLAGGRQVDGSLASDA